MESKTLEALQLQKDLDYKTTKAIEVDGKFAAKVQTELETMHENNPYMYVCSSDTLQHFKQYKTDLIVGKLSPGRYLKDLLLSQDIRFLNDAEFIEYLVQTKEDCVITEKADFNSELNWNTTELNLLSGLSCVIPTKAYDNGISSTFRDGQIFREPIHEEPVDVTLIHISSPLLHINQSLDLDEVFPGGVFSADAYYKKIETRILPGLIHVNAAAIVSNEGLFVTIPPLSWAKKVSFDEQEKALKRLLTEHAHELTQVKAFWFDNFDKKSAEYTVEGIDFLVRPSTKKTGLPQLCSPGRYDEKYTGYKLVSIMAGGPESKPGCTFWKGKRDADDAIKAAATGILPALTGKEGVYKADIHRVVPKDAPEKTWSEYMKVQGGFAIKVHERFVHYSIKSKENKHINRALIETPSTPQLSKNTQYRALVQQKTDHVYSIITLLKDRIGRVEQHHSNKAKDAALALLEQLTATFNVYKGALIKNELTLKEAGIQFTNECRLAIEKAKPILEWDLKGTDYIENLFKWMINSIMKAFGVTDPNRFFTCKVSPTFQAVVDEELGLTGEKLLVSN